MTNSFFGFCMEWLSSHKLDPNSYTYLESSVHEVQYRILQNIFGRYYDLEIFLTVIRLEQVL